MSLKLVAYSLPPVAIRKMRPFSPRNEYIKGFSMKYFATFLAFLVIFCVSGAASAQDGSYPQQSYWRAMAIYADGEYEEAIKAFQGEVRGGLKQGPGNLWLDSLCASAMLGESYYQMGRYAAALEQYNRAIMIYLQQPDWLERIQDAPAPGRNPMQTRPPWGETKPNRQLTRVPKKVQILFGFLDNSDPRKHGGLIAMPSLHALQADEVMRCTALAIRRRAELLGPLSAGDDLNVKMLSLLNRQRAAMAGSWMQAWVDVITGFTLFASGRDAEGTNVVMRGMLIAGGEHALTAMVYAEMGRQKLHASDYQNAVKLYLEAATLAYYFEDVVMLEEALAGVAEAYYHANQPQVCPAVVAAEQWAKLKRLPVLRTSLLISLAEENLRRNQLPAAGACLVEAGKTMGRRTMQQGKIGARWNFLRARVAFRDQSQAGQKLGQQAIQAAMGFMQSGSVWNFQLTMIDDMYLAGGMTDRKADEIYDKLLKEPTANDWALHPMESLAFLIIHRPVSWENWFWAAYALNRKEKALEIADRARRARFLNTLGYGGRTQALRMLLELPEAELNISQRQRRTDILTDYPAYAALAKQAGQLQAGLKRLSLPPQDKESVQTLTKTLTQLTEISQNQELILNSMVLDRRGIDILFPPVKTVEEIRAGMRKGEAMLVFFASRQQLYVFLMNQERLESWVIRDAGGTSRTAAKTQNTLTSLQTNLAGMLREIGMSSPTTTMKSAKLKDTKWQELSQRVMSDLTKNSPADFSRSDFTTLILVPDHFIWYLPFEMLHIQTPQGTRPAISRFNVRYAPMASLGVPWKRRNVESSPYTALVMGKTESPTEETLEKFIKSAGKTVEFNTKDLGGLSLKSPVAVSSIYGKCFDKIAVFDDIRNNVAQPYTVAPMSLDAGRPGAALADWSSLPYGGPRVMMMMGFHTQAESYGKPVRATSAKKPAAPQAVPGQELFFTSMGFLVNGCDTVVLSRWRMNGDAAYLLAEDFLAEISQKGDAAEAWRHAVLKLAGTKISLKAESRVSAAAEDDASVAGTYPAFWAGYVVVDTGLSLTDAPQIVVPPRQPPQPGGAAPVRTPPVLAPPDADADDAPDEDDAAAADEDADEAEETPPAVMKKTPTRPPVLEMPDD